jgi:hypothetical protein
LNQPEPLRVSFEFRLREKRAGQLQDLVRLMQFLDLAFQCLDSLLLGGARPAALSRVKIALANPAR